MNNDNILHGAIIGIGVLAALAVAIGIAIIEFSGEEGSQYHFDAATLPPTGLNCEQKTGKHPGLRVFTPEMLAKYDGSDEKLPLLLSVLGKVFDVTDGAKHYGRGEGYNCFVGKANSRAFFSGEFSKVRDDVLDMTPDQIATVTSWESFYVKHESYPEVGVVTGLYFDCDGTPTSARSEVYTKIEEVAATAQKEESIMKEFPICSMHSTAEETTIQCDGGVLNPYLLKWNELPRGRCGCVDPSRASIFQESNKDAVNKPVQFADVTMSVYPGCEPLQSQCVVKRAPSTRK